LSRFGERDIRGIQGSWVRCYDAFDGFDPAADRKVFFSSLPISHFDLSHFLSPKIGQIPFPGLKRAASVRKLYPTPGMLRKQRKYYGEKSFSTIEV
jgi:hypothetical protein